MLIEIEPGIFWDTEKILEEQSEECQALILSICSGTPDSKTEEMAGHFPRPLTNVFTHNVCTITKTWEYEYPADSPLNGLIKNITYEVVN